MPLVKKLITIGRCSRAIIIPAEWLSYYERQGLSIENLLMELDGEITIRVPTEAESQSFAKEASDAEL